MTKEGVVLARNVAELIWYILLPLTFHSKIQKVIFAFDSFWHLIYASWDELSEITYALTICTLKSTDICKS